MSSVAEKIEALLKPTIESMGYELVQVRLMEGKNRLLQIMAERPDGSMNVDDCAAISHQVSAVLDVENVLSDAYRLEVSSPGIDRPLVKKADYEKFLGHVAKIELTLPVAGRKRFTGTLKEVSGEAVTLEVDGQPVSIELPDVQHAKLMLTDALIKQHTKKQAS